MKSCLLLLACFCCLSLHGQEINNLLRYRQPGSDTSAYFRLVYENDYFSATDYYYTQGILAELVSPAIKKLPVRYLFPRLKNATAQYGLAAESNAYTPTSIQSDEILYGDRPFAATLLLRPFLISAAGGTRLSSALNIGIIGPGAGGYEMQYGIHSRTGNILPKGWQHQIANDLVLNYEVNFEKQLWHLRGLLSVCAVGQGRLGTLSTKLGLGPAVMLGFLPGAARRNWNLYAYEHPQGAAIGYDATLQGGLFNKGSDYVIPSGEVSRWVFRNQYGFVFSWKKLYLEYYQRYITKEFKTGTDHHTGGIQAGVIF